MSCSFYDKVIWPEPRLDIRCASREWLSGVTGEVAPATLRSPLILRKRGLSRNAGNWRGNSCRARGQVLECDKNALLFGREKLSYVGA